MGCYAEKRILDWERYTILILANDQYAAASQSGGRTGSGPQHQSDGRPAVGDWG